MSLTINTNDNKSLYIPDINIYKDIKYIHNFEYDNDENDNIIEIDTKFYIINKIFEYAKYIHSIKNLNITEQNLFNYNKEFLDIKNDDLCEILNICDYLQYDNLIDIITDKIASDIQNCDSVDTLKKKFNITNIISEEEENILLNEINN